MARKQGRPQSFKRMASIPFFLMGFIVLILSIQMSQIYPPFYELNTIKTITLIIILWILFGIGTLIFLNIGYRKFLKNKNLFSLTRNERFTMIITSLLIAAFSFFTVILLAILDTLDNWSPRFLNGGILLGCVIIIFSLILIISDKKNRKYMTD